MENLKDIFKNMLLRNKKNIIGLLVLLIILVAVPLTLRLMQQQQTLRSRATTGITGVTFSGPNVKVKDNKTILKLNDQGEAVVDLVITSPLGGATTASPRATSSPATLTVTASPSPGASP